MIEKLKQKIDGLFVDGREDGLALFSQIGSDIHRIDENTVLLAEAINRLEDRVKALEGNVDDAD